MQSINKILKVESRVTESPIEKLIVEELLNYEDLEFETQYHLGKYRLDFAFPKYKVGLEVDGKDYHNSETQMKRDELRDEYLTKIHGWKIERVPAWFCYRYPEAAVVKALQHIPEAQKYKRYLTGKNRAISWLITDLSNRGEKEYASSFLE